MEIIPERNQGQSQIKPQINKKTPVAIYITVILFALFTAASSAAYYFNAANKKLIAKINQLQPDYEKLSRENAEMRTTLEKLDKDYKEAKKDLEAMSSEKDNLINEVRGLLAERGKQRDTLDSFDKVKSDLDAAKKESEDIKGQNANFRGEIQKLDALRIKIMKENEELKLALSQERDKSAQKKLITDYDNLQKQNSNLAASLKQAQTEATKLRPELSKAREEISKLELVSAEQKKLIDKLNKEYASAVDKNRHLEKRATEVPLKFSEIARQNVILKRQTANMHYNLGVFYLTNKEYTRAAVEFEKAIEINPDDSYSQFNLGYIYAEYIVDRKKAVEHFRQYLRLAKKDDKDVDWVRKYVLTWDTWSGRKPIE